MELGFAFIDVMRSNSKEKGVPNPAGFHALPCRTYLLHFTVLLLGWACHSIIQNLQMSILTPPGRFFRLFSNYLWAILCHSTSPFWANKQILVDEIKYLNFRNAPLLCFSILLCTITFRGILKSTFITCSLQGTCSHLTQPPPSPAKSFLSLYTLPLDIQLYQLLLMELSEFLSNCSFCHGNLAF